MFCKVTGYGGTTQRARPSIPTRDARPRRSPSASTPTSAGGIPLALRAGGSATIDAEDRRDRAGASTRATNMFNVPSARPRHLQRHAPTWPAPTSTRWSASASPTTTLQARRHAATCRSSSMSIPTSSTCRRLKNIKTITLSYTFFPHRGGKPAADTRRRTDLSRRERNRHHSRRISGELTWRTRTLNRTTTTTSSPPARGR